MDTKELLLAEARAQIARQGAAKTSFRTLGTALGIKSSSVHYHLGSKDRLLAQVALDHRAAFVDAMDEAGATTPVRRVLAVVEVFEAAFQAGHSCVCAAIGLNPQALDDATKRALARYFDTLRETLRGAYAEAGLGVRAGVVAGVTLSALEGALLIDHVRQQPVELGAVRAWIEQELEAA